MREADESLAGRAVGAYTLRSLIGQGGMGSVWLADRSDGAFQGLAAVKVMNASLGGRGAEARFRREGNILARLQHPHIAHLIDAGVSSFGQPYLVLEYIDGERIDRYCEARGLGTLARIRLFLKVLEAVAHAHGHLIVHRDLKPANVLVTPEGRVKLLDFGIAKLLEPEEGAIEATALTRDGYAALTPAYAAPEQLTGEPVTTATDVYALGVILYVLLTGRHPAGAARASAAELMRSILESEPRRMSDSVPRGRLRSALRGDLDNIVAQALKKDSRARYASVEALADDLRRYLDHRPVKARRDSMACRVARFARRNRAMTGAAAVLAGLLAGAVIRERTLRGRAEAEALKARAVEQYLVGLFTPGGPSARPDLTRADVMAGALLDHGAARVDALAAEPEIQAQVRGVLGELYASLGMFGKAVPLLQGSLEQQRSLHGSRHAATAEAMDRLGMVLAGLDRPQEGERLLREALALRRELLGNAPETAASLAHLAIVFQERREFAAAEPLFREALAIQRAVHGSAHEDVAGRLMELGELLALMGRDDEAEPVYREALAIQVRRLGEDHVSTMATLKRLGHVQEHRGCLAEAAALQRRALAARRKMLAGEPHPTLTVEMRHLAGMAAAEGRLDEAEGLLREAIGLDHQMFIEQYVAEGLNALGAVLSRKGQLAEAERTYRQALALSRLLHRDGHVSVAASLHGLGGVLQLQGDRPGAIAHLRESVAMYGRLVGEKDPAALMAAADLDQAQRAQKRTGAPRGRR